MADQKVSGVLSIKQAIDEALSLQTQGHTLEARKRYQQILQKQPDHASATHLCGLTYLETGEQDIAIAMIKSAIALQPNVAVFHFNLGVAARQHGDFQQATMATARATQIRPEYGEAWQARAELKRYQSADDPDIVEVLAQLEQPLKAEDQCFFHFAAGKMFDDCGAYDQAWQHYRRGNLLKGVSFDQSQSNERAEKIRSTYTRDYLQQREGVGAKSFKPIFVVGMPRSGSSLTEQVLASHSMVHGAGELKDIEAVINTMTRAPDADSPALMPQEVADEAWVGYGRSYMLRMAGLAGEQGLRPKGKRTVDKQPFNFFHLGFMSHLLPDAKFIHSQRHPLDTLLSCYFQNFANGVEFSFSIEGLASYYRLYRQMMDHWEQALPGRIFHLQYEQLVADPERVTRELLEFCELPWEESCLDFSKTERKVTTASSWQVRQPLYQRSVHRHEKYRDYLQPLIDELGELLDETS
jgi:tetratricopeptide (TPR) repeat protein